METIGAVIFFGGLITFLVLIIYSSTKKQAPDLTVPLDDGELYVHVTEPGRVYLTRITEGEDRAA